MKIFWNSRGEKVTWQNSAFLLLLLLSCFSCVRPSVTPWTAAHQAPPSMGFSRQKKEYWSVNLPRLLHLTVLVQKGGPTETKDKTYYLNVGEKRTRINNQVASIRSLFEI